MGKLALYKYPVIINKLGTIPGAAYICTILLANLGIRILPRNIENVPSIKLILILGRFPLGGTHPALSLFHTFSREYQVDYLR